MRDTTAYCLLMGMIHRKRDANDAHKRGRHLLDQGPGVGQSRLALGYRQGAGLSRQGAARRQWRGCVSLCLLPLPP